MHNSKTITLSTSLIQDILTLVTVPILISFILTPIRFSLEYIGLPEKYIFLIGLLWFTIGLSIYWGIKYKAKAQQLRRQLLS